MKQEQIDFYLILEKNGKLLSFYKDLAKPQIYHLHLDGEIENYQKHEIYIHDQKYVATVVKNNNLVTGDSFFNILIVDNGLSQVNTELLIMDEENQLKTTEKITSTVFYVKNK